MNNDNEKPLQPFSRKRKRLLSFSSDWFYITLEDTTAGPFRSKLEAKESASEYLRATVNAAIAESKR